MTRLTFLAGAALCALTVPHAAAQAANPADDGDNPNTGATAVDTLVVVANRNPEPLYRIGQSVTVLDAPAIRQSQAVSVDRLLDQTPGVSIVRNGGQGQTATVAIRGAQSEQTLVLIDGVQINDPSSPGAGFDFSNLMIGDISSIEVLRGSQSVLWGSQAIGGVVNIVTTAPPAGSIGGELNAEGGSRDSQYWRGAVGGTWDRLSVRLAGGYYSTRGISVFDGGTEPDGFHAGTFTGRLLFDVNDALQLDQRVFYNQSKSAFDGFSTPTFSFGDDTEYGTESELVSYSGVNLSTLGGRLKNRFAFEYARTNRRSFDPLSFSAPITETFYGDGASARFEYQGTAQVAPGYTAVFGAQHERTSVVTGSPAFFSPEVRAAFDIDSGYGQVQGEAVKGLTLTGGVRYDSHSRFGGHATGQVAGAWTPNGGATLLRASWSQGFKAPSLYQLYSIAGNLGLKPETSQSLDVGVEQRLLDGKVVLGATWFRLASDDLIDFVACANPFCNAFGGVYQNVNRALAQGVELDGSATLMAGLTVSGNYTYTDTENRSPGANFGKDLARRPRHVVNATVSYTWPVKLTTAVAVRYASRSFDMVSNTTVLHGYTVVDLRASYPLTDRIEVYGRIENLFDEHYETAFQYGSNGRGAFAGVRARF